MKRRHVGHIYPSGPPSPGNKHRLVEQRVSSRPRVVDKRVSRPRASWRSHRRATMAKDVRGEVMFVSGLFAAFGPRGSPSYLLLGT